MKPRWAGLAVLVGLLFFAAGLAVAWGWPKVLSLPERVHAELRRHGSRYVPLRDISPRLQKAIIATEDQTFYSNIGISFRGMARALWVDIRTRAFTEGGSTITQELARDQFLTPAKTISRKIREIILALLIARRYSKRRVLELYLNEVYFGSGRWGVWAACRAFFGRSPKHLTWPEATLLAGLPQAPGSLDPFRNWAGAKERQAEVLSSLVETGAMSVREARSIWARPIPLGGKLRWPGIRQPFIG